MDPDADDPSRAPRLPYWAAIFSSRLTDDVDGYQAAAARMLELARVQPGFLDVESARGADGLGITISYWTDRAALAAWRAQAEHVLVQAQGVARWYERYSLRIARVENESTFGRDPLP